MVRLAAESLKEHHGNVSSTYLGYEALGSYDCSVLSSRQAELYRLIHTSKIKLGSHL